MSFANLGMRGFRLIMFFTCAALVAHAQATNQKLATREGNAAIGGSIAVSLKNPKFIVACGTGKLMYSEDSGVKWISSTSTLPSGIAGTPMITADSKGNFHLVYSVDPSGKLPNDSGWVGQLFARSSGDNGKSWEEPVPLSPGTGKSQYNPGIVTHPKRESIVVTWTESDQFQGKAEDCHSNIMLSKSGSGRKWSKPIQVNQISGNCIDQDFTARGSCASISLDSKIFVTWANEGSMFYDRSYDGEMWISTDLPIIEQTGGWLLEMPGFGPLNNAAVVAVDNSPSRIHGTLFMALSDVRSGENDSDIWMIRSVNRGDNWTVPARINQDEKGSEQFLPRIAIDQANGNVYILFYDRRNYEDNRTDVYLAWSTDGGNQFKEKKINEQPIVPELTDGSSLGDYINLSVNKGFVAAIWTSFQNGQQEIWASVVRQADLDKEK